MDYSQFQQFCSSAASKLNSFDIFTNLENFETFGQFGNANMYYDKDWKDVTQDDSLNDFGKGVMSDKTCTINADVHYQIITSSMGFPQMP